MRAAGSAAVVAVLALSGCTLDLVDVDVLEDVAPRLVFTLNVAEDGEAAGTVEARFRAYVDPGMAGGVPRVVTDPWLSIGTESFEPSAVRDRLLVWPATATAAGAGAGAVEVVMPEIAGLPRTTFTTASLLDGLRPGPVTPDASGDWVFELTVRPPEGPVFARTHARWSVEFHGAGEKVPLLSLEGFGVPSAALHVSPRLLPADHPSDVVAVVRMNVTYEAESHQGGQRVGLVVSKEVRRRVSFDDFGGGDG